MARNARAHPTLLACIHRPALSLRPRPVRCGHAPCSTLYYFSCVAQLPAGAGAIRLILVGDGARPLTLEVTRRKAYTAAMQRVSTGDFTKRVSTPGAFNPGMYDKELSTGLGGLPIKVGEDTIGGISAAGAPGGDKDEACAAAGVDKIKDRLN